MGHVRSAEAYANVASGRNVARFYLADCLDVFRQLPAESVDVIVTSPPYNLGIRYNRYQDTLTQADYLAWTDAWIARGGARAAARRLAVPERRAPSRATRGRRSTWRRRRGRTCGCRTSSTGSSRSRSTRRRPAPPPADARPGRRPLQADQQRPLPERLPRVHVSLHAARSTALDRLALGVPYQDQSNIGRWRGAADGIRCRGNTWFIPYETIQRRDRDRPHPATFPSKLPEQCLRLHGLSRIELAMDPFTGLGSTAVACARLGVNFIGVGYRRDVLWTKRSRERETRSRGMHKATLRPARGVGAYGESEVGVG